MLKPKHYPRLGTAAAKRFYYADLEIVNFLNWVGFMAGSLDRITAIASDALDDTTNPTDISSNDESDESHMITELRKNRLLLLHMLHARMIDSYLTYLSEVLVECFSAKPAAMRSSEKIELEEVLQFDRYTDLITHIADRKVHSLSYQSFPDLNNFFKDRFGIDLANGDDKDFLIKAIETRNLIVHSRGLKNRRYIQKVGESTDHIGKTRDIGIKSLETLNEFLFDNVKGADKTLRQKLKVRGRRFNVPREFASRE